MRSKDSLPGRTDSSSSNANSVFLSMLHNVSTTFSAICAQLLLREIMLIISCGGFCRIVLGISLTAGRMSSSLIACGNQQKNVVDAYKPSMFCCEVLQNMLAAVEICYKINFCLLYQNMPSSKVQSVWKTSLQIRKDHFK